MEQQIKIAAKMYGCRDTAKGFFKEEFYTKIEPYKQLIRNYMEAHKEVGVIPAVTKLCELPEFKDNGMVIMMFVAAAVEIIEPSKP